MGPEAKDGTLLEQHVLNTFINLMSEQAPKNKGENTGKSQQNKFSTILWDEMYRL